MIEAKELRIGNYVLLQDKGAYQIDSGHDIDEIDSFDGCSKEFEDYCKPIPLTEEWLLRFGFEKTEKGSVSYQYTIGENPLTKDWLLDLIWLKELDEKLNQHLEDFPFYKNGYQKIKTVHQLQNLYFSLTNEELTIKP